MTLEHEIKSRYYKNIDWETFYKCGGVLRSQAIIEGRKGKAKQIRRIVGT